MPFIKSVCDVGAWLEQPTSALPLKRFGWLKKRALLSRSTVAGEKVHAGPASSWFGMQCPTVVGSVQGQIYKVAITLTALTISPYELIPKISAQVSGSLGCDPSELQGGILLWDGEDGNVVVQPVPNSVPSRAKVFLTSNIVRPYVR